MYLWCRSSNWEQDPCVLTCTRTQRRVYLSDKPALWTCLLQEHWFWEKRWSRGGWLGLGRRYPEGGIVAACALVSWAVWNCVFGMWACYRMFLCWIESRWTVEGRILLLWGRLATGNTKPEPKEVLSSCSIDGRFGFTLVVQVRAQRVLKWRSLITSAQFMAWSRRNTGWMRFGFSEQAAFGEGFQTMCLSGELDKNIFTPVTEMFRNTKQIKICPKRWWSHILI